MNFLELGLNEKIVGIMTKLGYTEPTEIQQKAIPVLLQKKDLVGRSETGSGKTFAFALPIIQNIDTENQNVQALVVCPTRELAMQDADEIKRVASELNIKVCAIFGGSAMTRQIDSLKRKPQIVVGTTGRIMDLIKRKALKIEDANIVVLDEADEMLDMGFRPDIENILGHTKKDRQTVLFSATIPDEIKDIIKTYQKDSVTVEVGTENKALDNIAQSYIFVARDHKNDSLKELFMSDVFGKTIVFVNTKRYAESLEKFLNKSGVKCFAIHGDLRQNERKRIMEGFKKGHFDILLATDVAARGLDIKEVKYVVNFDLPQQLEFYVHRIGRTARAGESGKVVNIITNMGDLSYMREIEKKTNAKILPLETASENLKQYFVDTTKLAKENSHFGHSGKNYGRFGKGSSYHKFGKERNDFHKGGEHFKDSYKNGDSSFNGRNKQNFDRNKRWYGNDKKVESNDFNKIKDDNFDKAQNDGQESKASKSFGKTKNYGERRFGARKGNFGHKNFREHRNFGRRFEKNDHFSDKTEGKVDFDDKRSEHFDVKWSDEKRKSYHDEKFSQKSNGDYRERRTFGQGKFHKRNNGYGRKKFMDNNKNENSDVKEFGDNKFAKKQFSNSGFDRNAHSGFNKNNNRAHFGHNNFGHGKPFHRNFGK